MSFTKSDKNSFSDIFGLIGSKWMLITAKKDGKINTMTASWGTAGIMWNKPIAMCVIRPQRYTKGFVDASDYFTLSFLPEKYRKELNYLGTKSGRDGDKIKETGLTPVDYDGNAVYFAESDDVLICKKIYFQTFDSANFLDPAINAVYNDDYHTMYFGEITDVLKRQS